MPMSDVQRFTHESLTTAELEEYDDGQGARWAGCTTCGTSVPVGSGRELASWWRAHLYAHIRGVIA